MDWFFIVSLLMSGAGLLWGAFMCVVSFKSKNKERSKVCYTKHPSFAQFREEVEQSYQKQIKLVNDGDIKMNILSNDSDGDNEMHIMNNFKKMIQSSMFVIIADVKGDFEI